ncbi:hypothetical protein X777_09084 [Ooceraea biroi]|uniref:Uncharacterized protein n=1 Tax=Ooceraea biroi TaxID=2015173 RepID=A0A026W8W5_OOCBI|nr:hypothetical protein X777_09084 [Ooceraea biroi]
MGHFRTRLQHARRIRSHAYAENAPEIAPVALKKTPQANHEGEAALVPVHCASNIVFNYTGNKVQRDNKI